MSPFLSRGFRPFFLGAALFAPIAMANWLAVYRYGLPLDFNGLPPALWHAHEMIFGYAMAVVAGFLLTAAWNWTERETASGATLALLFLLWVAARALMLPGAQYLWPAAAADLAFMLLLALAVARPILQVRQKRQAPVLLLLALLTAANLSFYLGAAGWLPGGARYGVHAGLYLVLGMVLFMGNRVIPFFTERGVGYEVQLQRRRWNDIATFVLYALFLLAEVLLRHPVLGALLAAALMVLNSIRVSGWYTLGIWQKPLLWSLFAAFTMINLGFLLRALMPVTGIPEFLSIHAYAVGGVGTVTVAMMARVTLGHTGRSVHQVPALFIAVLIGLVLAGVIRIFLPLVDVARYPLWVFMSGLVWVAAFALFALLFIPMLIRPRADEPPPR